MAVAVRDAVVQVGLDEMLDDLVIPVVTFARDDSGDWYVRVRKHMPGGATLQWSRLSFVNDVDLIDTVQALVDH